MFLITLLWDKCPRPSLFQTWDCSGNFRNFPGVLFAWERTYAKELSKRKCQKSLSRDKSIKVVTSYTRESDFWIKNFNSDKNSIKYKVLGEYGKEGLRLRDVARSSGGKVSSLLLLLAWPFTVVSSLWEELCILSPLVLSLGDLNCRLPFDLWKNWRWLGTYSNVAWYCSTLSVNHKHWCITKAWLRP